MRPSKPQKRDLIASNRHRVTSKGTSRTWPDPEARYDRESGQVFRETEVVFSKRHSSDWIGEYKNPRIVKKVGVRTGGLRSLFETALIKCVKEFRSFTPEHLEAVPWEIGQRLWHEVILHHRESFHTWRTFAVAYGPDFATPENRYMLDIKTPPLQLAEYYQGITSQTCKWMTALRISSKQITIPDLVAVSSLTNLVALDLSDGQMYVENRQSPFDSRVLRTWSEMASAGRAFQHLSVLLFGWQENLDSWLFRYLNCFPALQLVVVTDCRHLHQKNRKDWEPEAETYGWEALHAKRSAKILRPLLDDKSFHVGNVSNCFYHVANSSSKDSDSRHSTVQADRPLLECWLGTPRSWLHIIDEFPGTRTILFQKKPLSEGPDPLKIETNKEVENTKRACENVVASPPHKRTHKDRTMKPKMSNQTTMGLLAEFGI